MQISSLGLMDNEWQEREQNLLRQLEDERFRYLFPSPPPCQGLASHFHVARLIMCRFRWGEALRLEEQRIRIEEAAIREEALQVPALCHRAFRAASHPFPQAETDRLGQVRAASLALRVEIDEPLSSDGR